MKLRRSLLNRCEVVRRRNTERPSVTMYPRCFLPVILAALMSAQTAPCQQTRLIREKVHGQSLQNNVIGEPVDRNVSIYLPPSYWSATQRHFPTVYLLHGINDTDLDWTSGDDPLTTIQGLMDIGIAQGRLKEMIVVMPDERTRFLGSFYSNSSSSGNWEDFTIKDLIDYVDNTYRTIKRAASRGIGGHSMGGYGAITLGMKHPDIYSVVYGLSPAVLGWTKDWKIDNPSFKAVLAMSSLPPIERGHLYELAIICVAQAVSPNPKHPPFYADFPVELANDGKLRTTKTEQIWEEHMPLYSILRYKSNLMTLKGLRFDAGYEDEFTHIPAAAHALSDRLTSVGIPHEYEEYNGDHRNRLWGINGRISTRLLPYFSALLEAE
jgi:S-formylglutathione hydrolase